jgi:hypothetical protein
VKDAEKVAGLSCEERLDVSLLQELPSDDEWDEEVSPGKDAFQDAYIPMLLEKFEFFTLFEAMVTS